MTEMREDCTPRELELEITIPVLNEERRLERGVVETLRFLEGGDLRRVRLVIVDNGSTDSTPRIAAQLANRFASRVSFLRISQRGVGAAVRASWSGSTADIVGYMDVDLATELEHLHEVVSLFERDRAQVVNGSRLLRSSVVKDRSALRGFTSWTLNLIMRWYLGVRFTDSMTGFKFFERRHAQMLLSETPDIPDWFVTAELLVRSEWRGVPVIEIPIYWSDDPDSKANVPRLARQYLGHIQRLRRERQQWTA